MSTDPFDALRLPAEPAAPDPAFVRRLRRRLVATLGEIAARAEVPIIELDAPAPRDDALTPTRSSTPTTQPRSTSMLTPYLCVAGAADAIAWYTTVFGARETTRYTGDDGRVGHAELTIGDAQVFLADEYPEIGVLAPATIGGTAVSLHLDVADVDATHRAAVERGARSEREPADQPYGARSCTIVDPFGHRWLVQTAIADPTPREIEGAMGSVTITTATAPTRTAPIEVGYLTLAAPDPDRAARFYGALFGWDTEVGNLGGEYRHVHNTALPMGIVPGRAGSGPVLYFRVPSVAEYTARVRALGGEVLSEATWDSGPGAECRDDQGCPFHVWEAAPGY